MLAIWFWQLVYSMNIALSLSLVVITIFYIQQSELLQIRRNYFIALFFISVSGYFISNHLYIFYFLSFENTNPILDVVTATFPMLFSSFATIALVFFMITDSKFHSKISLIATVCVSSLIILIIGIGVVGYSINRFTPQNDVFPLWIIDLSVIATISIGSLVTVFFTLSCFIRPLREKIFTSDSLLIGYQPYWVLGTGIFLLLGGELFQYVDSELSISAPEIVNLGIIGALLTFIAFIILILAVYSTRRRIKEKFLLVIEEQLAMRDYFISIASHELRTPITVIKGYINAMDKYDISLEKKKQIMEAMRRNIRRLELLTENAFNFSEQNHQMFTVSREKHNLADVIEKTVEDMKEISTNKRLVISFDKLPEITQHDTFVCNVDADRLSQVIRNLLHNSIKFTPQGKVSVLLERRPESIRISVNDTGVGIDPKKLGKIFDAFTTIDAGSINSKTGLGLGLFISKKIIRAHGGKIWAESQTNNVGTQIHIEIPIE